jgi:hypothetical protein
MNWNVFRLGAAIAVAAALVAIAVVGYIVPFFLALVGSGLALIYGLPALLVALAVLAMIRWMRPPRFRHPWETAIGVVASAAVLCILMLPAVLVGGVIQDRRFTQGRENIVATTQALDEFKQRFGHYPKTLEEASAAGIRVPVPPFADEGFYAADSGGEGYRLCLSDPCTLFDYWEFDSQTRQWTKCD